MPTPTAQMPMAVYCRGCGYDLRGTASGECPECGAKIDASRVRIGEWRPDWRWGFVVSRLLGAQILTWIGVVLVCVNPEFEVFAVMAFGGAVIAMFHNAITLPSPVLSLVRSRTSPALPGIVYRSTGLVIGVAHGLSLIAAVLACSLFV